VLAVLDSPPRPRPAARNGGSSWSSRPGLRHQLARSYARAGRSTSGSCAAAGARTPCSKTASGSRTTSRLPVLVVTSYGAAGRSFRPSGGGVLRRRVPRGADLLLAGQARGLGAFGTTLPLCRCGKHAGPSGCEERSRRCGGRAGVAGRRAGRRQFDTPTHLRQCRPSSTGWPPALSRPARPGPVVRHNGFSRLRGR